DLLFAYTTLFRSNDSSVLGTALKNIMHNSSAHIMAMTGSYFRGDSEPILSPEDEQLFDKVTYTYYEQLDGYQYLKSFGIDYKFYQGSYLDALPDAIDTTKKTIIRSEERRVGKEYRAQM